MMKSDNNKALFSNHYLDELASLRSQIMTSKARGGRHIFLIPSRSRAWIWQEGKQKPNVDLTRSHYKQIARKEIEFSTPLTVMKSELRTGEIYGKSQKEQQH